LEIQVLCSVGSLYIRHKTVQLNLVGTITQNLITCLTRCPGSVHHQYEGWSEDTPSLRHDPGEWDTKKKTFNHKMFSKQFDPQQNNYDSPLPKPNKYFRKSDFLHTILVILLDHMINKLKLTLSDRAWY
jgi:hypothetical protein